MSSVAVPRATVQRGISQGPDGSTWPGARVDLKHGLGGVSFKWFRNRIARWSPSVATRDMEYERMRSAWRAGRNLEDRCVAGGLRFMWTFTHGANVRDLNVSRDCVRRLQRLLYDRGLKLVGVAERQKRGAWHWHLAVDRYVPLPEMEAMWSESAGDLSGFVYPPKKGAARVEAVKAARYLAKYLVKTFVEEEERVRYGHHYIVSRGLVPQVNKYLLLGTSRADMLAFIEEETARLGFATRAYSSNDETGWSGRGWGDG